jgi:hypothetical protein
MKIPHMFRLCSYLFSIYFFFSFSYTKHEPLFPGYNFILFIFSRIHHQHTRFPGIPSTLLISRSSKNHWLSVTFDAWYYTLSKLVLGSWLENCRERRKDRGAGAARADETTFVTGMKLTKGIPAWIPRWPGDP